MKSRLNRHSTTETNTGYYKGWRLDQAFDIYGLDTNSGNVPSSGYLTTHTVSARLSEDDEWRSASGYIYRYYNYWRWCFHHTGISRVDEGFLFTGNTLYNIGGGSGGSGNWVNLRVYVKNPNRLPSINYIFNSHNTTHLDISLNTLKNYKSLIPYQTEHEFTVTTNTTTSIVALIPVLLGYQITSI